MNTKTVRPCGRIALTLLTMALAGPASAAVDFARDGGPVEFGAAELDAALRLRSSPTRVVLVVAGGGAPESFRVRVRGDGAAREVRIEGADAAGAMYGAMEVAETIRLDGPAAVQDLEKSPHLRVRGTNCLCIRTRC